MRPARDPINWQAMTDDEFVARAETQIWLSAFGMNNPRTPAHRETDAAYDEAHARKKPWLYSRAWLRAYQSNGYTPSGSDVEAATEAYWFAKWAAEKEGT